ncbi:HAD-IIA family hydrolase [Fulvivirgaceae bacterium BMA10]|uniref:HAD-IIA family hydrolase n=1 Tax=Splendidivirga corallicola TaxID=3051826 RepID=A0ABT8KRE8_9BACT|nr:HAD-IIA family hydrolase [Fulvivirgaceae bacterium BMA10]
MSNYGFLLDMDGVLYRGEKLIEGAQTFISNLIEKKIPFLFLTNNSSPTPKDLKVKLKKFGLAVGVEHFYTCAMATVDFLKLCNPEGTAYVIGEGGILTALHDADYGITTHDPDFVIVGEGRTLNYESLEIAQNMILNGAHLIATNMDETCPTSKGYRPGCGALVASLERATGKKAYSVGKPSPFMMRAARKKLGLSTAQTIMIGDTMETDIKGAFELGFNTILVLSGNTSKEDLKQYPYQPSLIFDNLGALKIEDLFQRISPENKNSEA